MIMLETKDKQWKTEKKTTNLKLPIEKNLLLKTKASQNLLIKRNHLMVMIVNPLIRKNRFLKVLTNRNHLIEKKHVLHALLLEKKELALNFHLKENRFPKPT